ncbi:unnamed protein product [Paramecium sonneborni]|uniref:Uncharacterized protein n=1 Tax=Paramecium sonneborni TaxID=65129 RepID=A0A8S1RDH2_9CILI|nr:unnamed protein product [Paramecium sonneborni]
MLQLRWLGGKCRLIQWSIPKHIFLLAMSFHSVKIRTQCEARKSMRIGPMFRKGYGLTHNSPGVKRLMDTDHSSQFSTTFDLGQKKNPDEQEALQELLTVPRKKKRRREKDLSRAQPTLPWDLFFLIRKSIPGSFTRQ